MFCNKCNHKLPDDSAFCQYCGNRIEKEEIQQAEINESVKDEVISAEEYAETSETELPDLENATPEEALEAIIKLQAEQTIKNLEENSQNQPNNEGDVDFGLVPEKPIYTFALMSVDGEREYLNRLCTENGIKVNWERQGSTSAAGVNGIIDIYNTYLPSGEFYKTIYINMYGAKKSETAPAGFTLKSAENAKKKKPKRVKKKYCCRCGSLINGETMQCTGCGRKYFKGIRFNKIFFIVLSFSLVLLMAISLIIYQYNEIKELKKEYFNIGCTISNLTSQSSILETQQNNELNNLKWEYIQELKFFRNHAEIVPDDNSNKYHKYGCSQLDTSNGYWIYNSKAAESEGYKKCNSCH